MKKKTKFRLKNDLAVPFWIAIIICLLCAGGCYYLFHTSFFRALSKMNEEPIATITFKHKTAQRKFLERVVWDRLRQNSFVYNGDTIHTAELSEATVWFTDGTILELAESSMAQVFRHDDGMLSADLSAGTATVDSTIGSGFVLNAGRVRLNIKEGTKISATKTAGSNGVNLTIQKGDASMADGTDFASGNTFSVDENGVSKPLLSVVRPLPSEKIVYYEEGLCAFDFAWRNADGADSVSLVIARDRDFTDVVEKQELENLGNATLNLAKGTYYYRLSALSGGVKTDSREGKFQVIQALKPSLLVPVSDYTYSYRKRKPSIRFIWTDSEAATAYNFVVSKNPDMSEPVIFQRSSSVSAIISTLEKGTYYWQVTPYYVVNSIGLANPSEIGTFKISQYGELSVPALYTPVNGEFVDKQKGKITLSWKSEPEANSYKVFVSQNKSLRSPVIERETTENYIVLSKKDVESLKDGQYFWAVSFVDSEGNVSELSEIRAFYAMSGEIVLRTVFPGDNYTIWQPLLSDMRFTWKTNLVLGQHIQVAKDSDFRNIVFDVEEAGSSFNGLNLEEGTYWWRILTSKDGVEKTTPGKMFKVVGEMPRAELIVPTESKRAVVRPNENFVFKWGAVDDADYYRIKLYKSGELLLDENFVTGTSYPVYMGDFDEGVYSWELQAFRYETENSSRISGMLSSSDFELRKIRPVQLLQPENEKIFDGWEFIDSPPALSWKSFEPYSAAKLVLRKIKGLRSGEKKVFAQNSYSQQLEPLSAGTYEWTVEATTMDDIDMSAMEKPTFTIKEIPPFEPPAAANTEGGTYFDAKYLKKKKFIMFSWEKVNRATEYILEIKKGDEVVVQKILPAKKGCSFKLDNLPELKEGEFTWSLKASRLSKDKKDVLIDGKTAEGRFTIDYSLNSDGGKRKDLGTLYGK